MRLVNRIGVALVAFLFVLVCAGAIYQLTETWRDSRRFPQRGMSFRAGSIRLNLDCSGKGSPVVILESGLGGPAIDWILVQPEIAKFTRVCSYDRAGYGWSDSSPEPRTSSQIAKELKALLAAAGERGPYVLVGHSFGGYNVRVFTGLYPKEVVGIVLVDASHPDEEKRVQGGLPLALQMQEKKSDERREMWDKIFAPIKIHLGIDRLSLAMGWENSPLRSKKLQRELLYLEQQPKYLKVIEAEDKLFSMSGKQAVAAGSLGDRPLIVLTAGKPYEPDPLLTKEQAEQENNMWVQVLQVEEMHLSSRGKQVVLPDTGHEVPFERPNAVVSAVHEVWSDVR